MAWDLLHVTIRTLVTWPVNRQRFTSDAVPLFACAARVLNMWQLHFSIHLPKSQRGDREHPLSSDFTIRIPMSIASIMRPAISFFAYVYLISPSRKSKRSTPSRRHPGTF